MKKIEKVYSCIGFGPGASKLLDIEGTLDSVIEAVNELLETHTVKEQEYKWDLPKLKELGMKVKEAMKEPTPPSNSEKEEVKEQPTTPETKVKISCPDCPHEETDAPEKKCSDESMVASGYIKTPTGWIAQGEATPAQMVYHVSYEVTCGRCEKSIKHSCGRV